MILNAEFGADIMQNINQSSNTPISVHRVMFGPEGWADLPHELLHSIIVLLGSTRDLLAFIATCPSWYAAFMSIKSTSGELFHLLFSGTVPTRQAQLALTLETHGSSLILYIQVLRCVA